MGFEEQVPAFVYNKSSGTSMRHPISQQTGDNSEEKTFKHLWRGVWC
jgi:hypothetical protein